MAEWSPRTPGLCPPSLSFCPNTSFSAVSPGDPVTNLNALLLPSVPALLSSLAHATLFLRLLSVSPPLTVCKDRPLRAIPPGLERCWWVGRRRPTDIYWMGGCVTFSFNGFIEKSLTFYATSTLSVHHPVASSIFMEAGKLHGSLSWGVFL